MPRPWSTAAHPHVAGVRPAGRQRRPVAARVPASPHRTRWPSTSTTARSTSRRPTPPTRSASSRSTPTTATPTTSSSTCGRTPTPWPSCSTACSSSASRAIRDRVPGVRSWLWVDDGTATCPPWAVPYEEAAETTGAHGPAATSGSGAVGRGPDDVHMLYTGGTTGMPKGVMWRQDDLFARLNGGGFRRYPPEGSSTTCGPSWRRRRGHDPASGLPADARHRGFTAMECLSEGGRIVTLVGRQFDPVGTARHHRGSG